MVDSREDKSESALLEPSRAPLNERSIWQLVQFRCTARKLGGRYGRSQRSLSGGHGSQIAKGRGLASASRNPSLAIFREEGDAGTATDLSQVAAGVMNLRCVSSTGG